MPAHRFVVVVVVVLVGGGGLGRVVFMTGGGVGCGGEGGVEL